MRLKDLLVLPILVSSLWLELLLAQQNMARERLEDLFVRSR